MSEKDINTNEQDNNNSNEKKTEELNIDSKENILNEEEINEDSKSTIIAPYNSEESNNDDSEEEKEELDILNKACIFENLAQQANTNYEKNYDNY